MKVIYNPGGFASACFAQRKEGENLLHHRYTKLEKLNILAVFEKLQVDKGIKLLLSFKLIFMPNLMGQGKG